jgi:hypothetical protein
MTDQERHEKYVELYRLLEDCWVNRPPNRGNGEHCLATGVKAVVGHGNWQEYGDLMRPIRELTCTDYGHIGGWNDSHSKEEALAVVAQCVADTAPPPPALVVECPTTRLVVA